MVRLEARNEIAVAWIDGAVAASAPDCFCLLSRPGHHLLDIERVEAGMDLEVLVLPAAERWHTPEGSSVTLPRAYGFEVRRVPMPAESRPTSRADRPESGVQPLSGARVPTEPPYLRRTGLR